MDKNSIRYKNWKHLSNEQIHDIAVAIKGINWAVCSKVKNIVENNPYVWLDAQKLWDMQTELLTKYSEWLIFSVYEILIDHLQDANKKRVSDF